MRRAGGSLLVIATLILGLSASAFGQDRANGKVIVPDSSVERAADAGKRAHTNFVIFQPTGVQRDSSTPPTNANTPASLACVYNLVTKVSGCPIKGTTLVPTGGAGAIALVDADDNPNAASDLATFSTQFGLAPANFVQVYANGKKPPNNAGGWSLEEALDIEMAHAMAPNAEIILVEAASASNADLFAAEAVASSMVAAAGGGEVSNSWGESEFSGETSDDSKFASSGVVYFASTGDSCSASYPATSPNVVAAGGTSINRSGGNFTTETTWSCSFRSGSGSGKSKYEARPSYQSGVSGVVGTARGIPDFSFDANPNTGVAVYDADGGYNWVQIGGTSVSSPALAGIVNAAGLFATSSNVELTTIYSNLGNSSDFRDITSGKCGTSNKLAAAAGYDLCAGVGSDQGLLGK